MSAGTHRIVRHSDLTPQRSRCIGIIRFLTPLTPHGPPPAAEQVLVELALEVADPDGGVGVEDTLLGEVRRRASRLPTRATRSAAETWWASCGAELASRDPEGETHQACDGHSRDCGGGFFGPVEPQHRLGQTSPCGHLPGQRGPRSCAIPRWPGSRDSSARSSVLRERAAARATRPSPRVGVRERARGQRSRAVRRRVRSVRTPSSTETRSRATQVATTTECGPLCPPGSEDSERRTPSPRATP